MTLESMNGRMNELIEETSRALGGELIQRNSRAQRGDHEPRAERRLTLSRGQCVERPERRRPTGRLTKVWNSLAPLPDSPFPSLLAPPSAAQTASPPVLAHALLLWASGPLHVLTPLLGSSPPPSPTHHLTSCSSFELQFQCHVLRQDVPEPRTTSGPLALWSLPVRHLSQRVMMYWGNFFTTVPVRAVTTAFLSTSSCRPTSNTVPHLNRSPMNVW